MSRKRKYHPLRSVAMGINWLAAALLLVSYLSEKSSPLQHAFFALAGLVYLVLFFVNLFFVVFWLFRKDVRMLVSLLIILMGFPHIRENFSFHFRKNRTNIKGFKILSYNVQGFSQQNNAEYKPEIKAAILSFLLKENPDLICLQEYSGKRSDLFRKSRNENVLFHRYYTQKGSKNTGLVIISKYKIIHSNFLKFKGYRTFGLFADVIAGKDTLRLVNIHLASISLKQEDLDLLTEPPNPAWKKQDVKKHFLGIFHKLQFAFRLRERQLNAVLKIVKSSPYRVVLCGDFNDTPSSNAYHRVAVMLTDAFVKKGNGLSATYAGPLPFLRIDYLFTSPKVDILSYKKYSLRLSDHFPISMTIKLPNQ